MGASIRSEIRDVNEGLFQVIEALSPGKELAKVPI